MGNRIFIFAFNKDDKPSPWGSYRGCFDGVEFVPKLGFCSSIDELYEYEYVQLFGENGCLVHSPKKFNKDLKGKMKRVYVEEFGEIEQINLFA